MKETIESILIAFILAFVFRSYVLEAFVIPTGSMASTLMGAHTRHTCPDCNYPFEVNVPTNGDNPIPSATSVYPNIYCPNCGFQLLRRQKDAPPVPVHYGDRILVQKYIYLVQEPSRWDVVVFKSPYEPRTYNYQQNYIKRLVGLPGESVMILDGDLFTKRDTDPDWLIQSKPWSVQQALWRVVYDNDHRPQGLERGTRKWQQPWKPEAGGTGWTTADSSGFVFNNPSGSAALSFDAQATETSHSFNDYLVYDTDTDERHYRAPTTGPDAREPVRLNPVSDLMLRCFYERTAGDGPMQLELGKGVDTFIAELTPGRARLLVRRSGGATQELASTDLTTPAGRPIFIEFLNVDHRVSLRLDRREVLATTREQYAPDVARLMEDFNSRRDQPYGSARLVAANQSSRLTHVSLWRDVFYTNTIHGDGGPMSWAMPDRPVDLGAGEYFVLGDNSFSSADARYWTSPINLPAEDLSVLAGRVPARFMLGRAFFVYWPAGFTPIDARVPSIIPNFGSMRFIH